MEIKNKKFICLIFFVIVFINANAQNLIPYRDNKLWGFCDTLGKVMVDPQFSKVSTFNEGLALVQKNKKYSYCNESGLLTLNYYDSVKIISNKYIGFLQNGKWGILRDKIIIVNPIYNEFTNWGEAENVDGSMELQVEAKKGLKYYVIYLNAKKKPVVKNILQESTDAIRSEKYRNEYVEDVQIKNKCKNQIDSIAALKGYDSIIYITLYKFNVYDNPTLFYKIKKGENFGVVRFYYNNNTEKLEVTSTTPIEYQSVSSLDFDGRNLTFVAKKNNKVGIILNNGEVKVPIIYDKIEKFNSNYAITILNNKKGCKIFNTIYPYIDNKYDDLKFDFKIYAKTNWTFLVFKVMKDNKIGYVGENGVEYFKN